LKNYSFQVSTNTFQPVIFSVEVVEICKSKSTAVNYC